MKKTAKKKNRRLTPAERPMPIPAPKIIDHEKVYNRKKAKANFRKEQLTW